MPDAEAPRETQPDRNAAVVRHFIDGWVNGGDLDVIDETWSDDMSWHGGGLGTYEGREAFKRFTAANAAGAFADMHLEIHELISHGDNQGTMNAHNHIPPVPGNGTNPNLGRFGGQTNGHNAVPGTATSPLRPRLTKRRGI